MNKPVLGHPAGLGQRFLRVVDELEAREEAGVVEGVVVEGQVLGKPAVEIDPVAGLAQRDVEHVGGGVDPGHLQAHVQEGGQAGPGAAADVEDGLARSRLEHARAELDLHARTPAGFPACFIHFS
jgi:hypothetical protein